MNTKHTPGKWRFHTGQLGRLFVLAGPDDPTRAIVIASETTAKETKANLRLISAAPELLDALENAMSAVRYYHEHEGAPTMLRDTLSAIAKAKGETS